MDTGARLRAVFFSFCLTLFRARAAPGVSCLRSSLGTHGQTLVSFLREDAAGARLLYLTRWAEDKRLVTCEINQQLSVTEGYRLSCDGNESRGQEEQTPGFNVSALLSRDALCALPEFTERAARDEESRGRRKRSWMFPGTLWCGSGSRAEGYEQLGEGVGLSAFSVPFTQKTGCSSTHCLSCELLILRRNSNDFHARFVILTYWALLLLFFFLNLWLLCPFILNSDHFQTNVFNIICFIHACWRPIFMKHVTHLCCFVYDVLCCLFVIYM